VAEYHYEVLIWLADLPAPLRLTFADPEDADQLLEQLAEPHTNPSSHRVWSGDFGTVMFRMSDLRGVQVSRFLPDLP
jgi:hypothetical protein